MFGSDLYVALVLGVTLSLIFSEKTGVVPAGLIVPGYLALVFDQWEIMLTILIISVVTYLIVTHGLSRWVILYGRRKFAAMMVTGICLKLLLDLVYPVMPFEIFEFRESV